MRYAHDVIEREIADIYPDADVEWLAADYRWHCAGIADDAPPTVRAWIDDQPASYLAFHGVPYDPESEPSRHERMQADYAMYRQFGGVATFETWSLRYGDDYPEAV